MFAGARRGNISHGWQGSLFKIRVILVEIDNMTGKLWIIEKTVDIEERHPNDLGSPVAAELAQIPVGDLRVIILNIELPGNPAFFEAIKYSQQVRVSISGNTAAALLGGCPEHVIRETAAMV